MKKDIDLLKKIVSDTIDKKIDWVRTDFVRNRSVASSEYWKGEKPLTDNKKIVVVFRFGKYDYSWCELRVYFVNMKYNTKDLIWYVEPGVFSFRTLNNIKKLIKSIKKYELEKKSSLIGPMDVDLEEEIFNDILNENRLDDILGKNGKK